MGMIVNLKSICTLEHSVESSNFKIQLFWYEGKILQGDINKLFVFKGLLTKPSNVLPLLLKQTFPPIILITNEDEGDGIESTLPFKIFSTLPLIFF